MAYINILQFVSRIIYPVGAVYQTSSDINPANIWGGRWEELTNRFLVGAGSTYAYNSTGGTASKVVVSHSHSLSHSHTQSSYSSNHRHSFYTSNNAGSGSSARPATGGSTYYSSYVNPSHAHTFNFSSGSCAAGSSTGSITNLPPYETYHIWIRIA